MISIEYSNQDKTLDSEILKVNFQDVIIRKPFYDPNKILMKT